MTRIIKIFCLICCFVPFYLEAQNHTNATNGAYDRWLREYKQGFRNYTVMPELAEETLNRKDSSLAKQVANDYMAGYLVKLKDNELYTPENIRFITEFTDNSHDQYFNIFYQRTGLVNQVMHKITYAQNVIDKVLILTDIMPVLKKLKPGNAPDWNALKANLSQKYDPLSGPRAVAKAKVIFYYGKDGEAYCKALIYYTNIYDDHSDMGLLNKNACDILKYSTDTVDLKSALYWSKKTVKSDSINVVYQGTLKRLMERIDRLKGGN